MALLVKNPPGNAGNIRHVSSIPGSGRSPGGGHGNPLQYSYLDNPMDRGAWWASVLGVAKIPHGWCDLSMHAHIAAFSVELFSLRSDTELIFVF